MTLEELEILLDSCKAGNRLSQKRLYYQYYGFGMSICNRYAHNREEAEEMCHDGFVKVFAKINDCQAVGSFLGWMRQIFVRSAIDYFRKYRQGRPVLDDIEVAVQTPITDSAAIDKMAVDEKLNLVKQLPAAYRMAFNLYAIEGFTTSEIAESLHIAEGTVRSNLAKARIRLQHMIQASDKTVNISI
ncbi:MAG: sigma-70 family RNA polymerase sigma factor [Saprospiraceae bacterium]